MKGFYVVWVVIFFAAFHDVKAQLNGLNFERFDSINVTNIKGIKENQQNYYFWDDYNIMSLDKASGVSEKIYHSEEKIIDGFIDSTGYFGFIKNKYLISLQSGTWIQEIIPSDSLPLNCMVDSSGAIFIAFKKDSLCKFENGNWTKFGVYTGFTYENVIKVFPGYHHECLVMGGIPNSSSKRIYKLNSSSIVYFNSINTTNDKNIEYDSLGYCWHREYNIIKKCALNGVITYFTVPGPGYISNFRLSKENGKLWIQKYYSNGVDSVFYFNGLNWNFVYSTNQEIYLYKTRADELLILNNTTISNIPINNIYTYLKVINDYTLVNYYPLILPLISDSIHTIGVWQYSDNEGEIEFIIGTHKGIYLRKRNWVDNNNSFIKIDSSNSALPNNNVLDIELKDYSGFALYDTLFIATNKGLVKARIVSDSLEVIQLFNSVNSGLPSDSLTKVVFNKYYSNQELWIGTNNNGLAKMNSNGTFIVFDTLNSMLPSNSIKNISIKDNIVCVSTANGFLILIDSIQHKYTMSNSGLLTQNINSVDVYKTYGIIGSNSFKYELIVSTNGYGFAIVDTNQIWHYYNTQNQNFLCDTVYFYRNLDYYENELLFTNCGIKSIYDFFGNLSINDYYQYNDNESSNAIDIKSSLIDCFSNGYRAGAITGNGILSLVECYWSTQEIENTNMQINASIFENNLVIESKLIGEFMLEFYDSNGKIILTESVSMNGKLFMSLPKISDGFYFLRLFNSSENYPIKVACW